MRAVFLLGTFSCIACLVSGQSITITGPSTLTTPTSELRITCTPSTAGISDINSITIKKNSSTLDYQNVVSVTYSKPNSDSVLTWGSIISNTRAGVSATGNVNTVSGASLVLTIAANRTTCTDGGAYQCLMGVTLTGGSGGVADAEKYVAATESPTSTNNPLTVFPFPNVDSSFYSVGTTLTLTCTGTVGSDRKDHTWCYKRANDFTYTGYPTGADINQNNDNLVQSGCNYQRTSTLTYNVTEADSNTTFMCEPFTGSMCGSNPASLIGYLSIKRYSTGGNTGAQDDSAGSGAGTSSAGTIAGAVIGAFAAILLIILIVYFVVFRRRGGGETYNTKEDGTPESGENGGPAHTEGPVYSVPDKNRARGQYMKVNRSSFRDISFSYSPKQTTPIIPASPLGQPPSPPREYESLVEAKRELHYADLDIASRPPGVPAPRLSKHTPTEYATVKFV